MKINFPSYKVSFTSYSIPKMPEEGLVLGYDGDSVSQANREYIRKHLEERAMLQYLDYYELPKTEYEMDRMIKSWGLKHDKLNDRIEIPSELNVKPLGNNCYRGALPYTENGISKLKQIGIKTVINASAGMGNKELFEKQGLKYIKMSASNIGDVFKSEEDITRDLERLFGQSFLNSHEGFVNKYTDEIKTNDRNFINKLIESVRAMQAGNCFIGCEYGTRSTDRALYLIDVFNSQSDIDTYHIKRNEFPKLKTLYNKLTSEDKKLMGWTDEYEKLFLKQFANLK